MLWGYPQDWLRTLGKRVRRIHFKDCQFAEKKFVPLGEGDVDWPAVVRAMSDIGYRGFVTAEPSYASAALKRGDRQALADLARRMDAAMRAG
jgi:hexulose-6-phosphate isomerase